jgi:hypothetical protein
MIQVFAFGGEFRLATPDGSLIGPTTQQDGFNGPLLKALREVSVAPERDSLGYVWPTREAAARCLRHVYYKCGRTP